MRSEEFDINTPEGARKYLEQEGLNVDQLVKDGLDFIEIVKDKIRFQKRWISVTDKDQSPKDYQDVLVLLENGEVFKATYCDDASPLSNSFDSVYFKLNKGVKITHWMPYELPHTSIKEVDNGGK